MAIEEFNSTLPRVEPKIIIPPRILRILEEMDKIAQGNEYALYLSAVVDSSNYEVWVDSEKFIVPMQTVSGGSVEPEFLYEDGEDGKALDPIDKEYNVVVHRHPEGCMGFSVVDEQYLNQNHGISFLYHVGYRVCDAMANFVAGDCVYDSRKLSAYTVTEDGEKIPLNCKFDYRGYKHLRFSTAPGVRELCDAVELDFDIMQYADKVKKIRNTPAAWQCEVDEAARYASRFHSRIPDRDLSSVTKDSSFESATGFLEGASYGSGSR